MRAAIVVGIVLIVFIVLISALSSTVDHPSAAKAAAPGQREVIPSPLKENSVPSFSSFSSSPPASSRSVSDENIFVTYDRISSSNSTDRFAFVPWPPETPPPWCRPLPKSLLVVETNNVSRTVSGSQFSPFNCSLKQLNEIPSHRKPESTRPRFAIITLSGSTRDLLHTSRGKAPPARPRKGKKRSRKYEASLTPEAFREIRRMSFANKLAYATRHGVDLIVEDESVADVARHGTQLAWAKLRAVRKWLPHYEWIVWVDHDAVFMNFSASIAHVVDERIPRIETILTTGTAEEIAQFRRHKNYLTRLALDHVNLHSGKNKRIDLLMFAEPSALNTGVFFIRNTSWSMDFLQRVHDGVGTPHHAKKKFTFFEQDQISFALNLDVARLPGNRDRQQVAEDRAHVFVSEENSWNRLWIGGGLYTNVRDVPRQWQYEHDLSNSTLLPAALKFGFRKGKRSLDQRAEPPSTIVHFTACKHLAQCMPWFRFEFEHTMAVHGAPELAPSVVLPKNFRPPL